jgi:reverse gyrase
MSLDDAGTAYEIMELCTRVNPSIRIKQAKLNSITAMAIWVAYNNISDLNKNEVDAINYKIEA